MLDNLRATVPQSLCGNELNRFMRALIYHQMIHGCNQMLVTQLSSAFQGLYKESFTVIISINYIVL